MVVILDAVAFFPHAVWRVGEYEISALTARRFLDVGHLKAVAAVEAVIAEKPKVAGLSERILWRFVRFRFVPLFARVIIVQRLR